MFEIDKRRIKACIEYRDYYSALQYAILISKKYEKVEKEFFKNIIKNIKRGNYEKLF